MQRLPEHGPCFVCGAENPHGIGAVWYERADGVITAELVLGEAQQGPPGYVHGGASAAVLDEVMGAAVWRRGYHVALVKLSVDYRCPVPLGQRFFVEGQLEGRDGPTIRARGVIRLADGRVAVEGGGLYLEAPHLFEYPFYQEREAGT